MTAARRLVLVDLDNLLGLDPRRAAVPAYMHAYATFADSVGISERDLVVVGVGPCAAWVAQTAAPGARIVTRTGPDGAEIRLLRELVDPGFVARRFGEVIVASGDHRFVDALATLNRYAVATTVASIPNQLSRRLRLVAQRVVWLPRPPEHRVAA